ncbi:MAG: DUF1646 family protein [bacterium]
MIIGLFVILLLVLTLPFFIKKVEENLEIFLFIMGLFAVTLTAQWNATLIREALEEPVKITLAVLAAGILFRYIQKPIAQNVNKIISKIGLKTFVFLTVMLLGFLSSVITAIVAALVLVEIVSAMHLDRRSEIKLVVVACFSIGFGAALTPIGEPLSTIVIGKLKDFPYNAGFWFILEHFWYYIVPAVLGVSILAVFFMKDAKTNELGLVEEAQEGIKDIILRTGKIYLFVMALVFLGTGFKPVVDTYISKIPYQALYWINIVSAVLDNATLAAAEIGPAMEMHQIKAAMLGLLIAGGMLIPGNIPNIIAAGKLKIKSKEWAEIGVPVGLIIMVVYFGFIMLDLDKGIKPEKKIEKTYAQVLKNKI